ncbi:hypothetical protein [Paenibacillus sp. GbtcB18]|uniref:hypothetical protein n=1 Tax=Paenibacillus sp. GbtcB18 TaxID=2824763 RepID=UPI001C2F53C9|nr:hypothetical protein [Paenibacillus sp. GbtcB18]
MTQPRRQRCYDVSAARHSRFGCAVPAKAAAKQKQPLSSPGQGLFFLLRRRIFWRCYPKLRASRRSAHTAGAPRACSWQMHRQAVHSALLISGAAPPAFPRTAPPTAKERLSPL